MKKGLLYFFALAGLGSQAQFTSNNIEYWVGTGNDTAILVVDFHTGTFDSSSAWGYLYNSGATMENMLNDIATADVNFSVNMAGGFLNDINYHVHAGIGGTNNQYWATYSGQDFASLAANSGITEVLQNGNFYACSFTAFNSSPPYNALLDPGTPIPAFEPFAFTNADVSYWVGTGSDSTIFVVDFLSLFGVSSNAFGYLHDGTKTAEDMLNDIAAAYPSFTVDMTGGFLNDIVFNANSGIGGSPNYWGTWSASNLGNWQMNAGITENLSGLKFFGCSYTDFAPVIRPNTPVNAGAPNGLVENNFSLSVYPNPSSNFLNVDFTGEFVLEFIDMKGKRVLTSSLNKIDISDLANGIYILNLQASNFNATTKWIKN